MTKIQARLSKEERIEKIMGAAIEVIARDGFKQASTKEIAQLAGCTEALIFKYFKTKEHILDFITKKVFEENEIELFAFFDKPIAFKEFLLRILNWSSTNLKEKTNLYKVIIRHEYINVEFGNFLYQQRLERRLQPLILECEQRKKRGELKENVNCEALAAIIMNLLNSIKHEFLFLEIDKDKILQNYKKLFKFVADSYTN